MGADPVGVMSKNVRLALLLFAWLAVGCGRAVPVDLRMEAINLELGTRQAPLVAVVRAPLALSVCSGFSGHLNSASIGSSSPESIRIFLKRIEFLSGGDTGRVAW